MKIKFNLSYIIIPLLTVLVGVLGSLSTTISITSGWYDTLNKPDLSPPNWIFGPVWTTIYILTAISLLIVWNKVKRDTLWKAVIALFTYNALVNVAWSFTFFKLGEIGWALLIATEIWGSVLLLVILLWKRSKIASSLLLPYLLWVSFAIYLNYAIWTLN